MGLFKEEHNGLDAGLLLGIILLLLVEKRRTQRLHTWFLLRARAHCVSNVLKTTSVYVVLSCL